MGSVLWSICLLCLVCRYTVHCSVLNSTGKELHVTLSGVGDRVSIDLENVQDDYDDHNEVESPEEDLSGYDIDDSIRVQAVVNPANGAVAATTVEKKKTDKKKKGGKRRKKTPCQTTHKDFCVNGKCRYLANAQDISCKCHENYFGKRCTELALRAETTNPSDMTTVILIVVAVLATLSITTIVIIIVVHTRRKYSSYDCEAEEIKSLGQENGSEDV